MAASGYSKVKDGSGKVIGYKTAKSGTVLKVHKNVETSGSGGGSSTAVDDTPKATGSATPANLLPSGGTSGLSPLKNPSNAGPAGGMEGEIQLEGSVGTVTKKFGVYNAYTPDGKLEGYYSSADKALQGLKKAAKNAPGSSNTAKASSVQPKDDETPPKASPNAVTKEVVGGYTTAKGAGYEIVKGDDDNYHLFDGDGKHIQSSPYASKLLDTIDKMPASAKTPKVIDMGTTPGQPKLNRDKQKGVTQSAVDNLHYITDEDGNLTGQGYKTKAEADAYLKAGAKPAPSINDPDLVTLNATPQTTMKMGSDNKYHIFDTSTGAHLASSDNLGTAATEAAAKLKAGPPKPAPAPGTKMDVADMPVGTVYKSADPKNAFQVVGHDPDGKVQIQQVDPATGVANPKKTVMHVDGKGEFESGMTVLSQEEAMSLGKKKPKATAAPKEAPDIDDSMPGVKIGTKLHVPGGPEMEVVGTGTSPWGDTVVKLKYLGGNAKDYVEDWQPGSIQSALQTGSMGLSTQGPGGSVHPALPKVKEGDKISAGGQDYTVGKVNPDGTVKISNDMGVSMNMNPYHLKNQMDNGQVEHTPGTGAVAAPKAGTGETKSTLGVYNTTKVVSGAYEVGAGMDGKYHVFDNHGNHISSHTDSGDAVNAAYADDLAKKQSSAAATPLPKSFSDSVQEKSSYTLQGDEKYTKVQGDYAAVWTGSTADAAKIVNTKTGEVVSSGHTSAYATNQALTRAEYDFTPGMKDKFDIDSYGNLTAKAHNSPPPPWEGSKAPKPGADRGAVVGNDKYATDAYVKQEYADFVATTKSKGAIRNYQGDGYDAINETLWSARGGDITGMKASTRIRSIDRAMGQSKTKEPMTMLRIQSKGHPLYKQIGMMDVGDDMIDHGFGSSSTNPEHSWGDNSVKVYIRAPKGTRGVFMNAWEDSKFPTEHEFLVARGTRYRLVGKTVDSSGNIVATVEVVSQQNLPAYKQKGGVDEYVDYDN